MSTWAVALTGLGVALAIMTLVWAASLRLGDVSIVDRFWGPVFVVLAWVYVVLADGDPGRSLLMAVLTTVWGLRLAAYVTWRNWGEGEDARYQAMRQKDPGGFPTASLWRVFWLQGVLAWIVAAPLLAAAVSERSLWWLDGLAVLVWAVGLLFEAVGDAQLARFLGDPSNRGKVMDRGLWRYTRHPNYFGDATMWWGLYLLAAFGGGWWAIVGPIVMTVTIVRVSGVALTEKRMSGDGGSTRHGYDEYVRRTNAFVPGPPKPARDGG